MASEASNQITRLLWGGKYRKAIEKLRPIYYAKPEEEFVSWISALYSARALWEYRMELLHIYRVRTMIFASRPIQRLDPDPLKVLDKVDVLTTVLEWVSRDEEIIRNSLAEEARKLAEKLFKQAEPLIHQLPRGSHTFPLLRLTRSQLRKTAGNTTGAALDLGEAKQLADAIIEPPQQERVYRKIGVLLRRSDRVAEGFRYGFRALFVRHTAWGVKAKSLAALFGIDS